MTPGWPWLVKQPDRADQYHCHLQRVMMTGAVISSAAEKRGTVIEFDRLAHARRNLAISSSWRLRFFAAPQWMSWLDLSVLAALSTGLHLAIASTQTGSAERCRTDALARCIFVHAVGKACIRSSVSKSQLTLKDNARFCECRSDQAQ